MANTITAQGPNYTRRKIIRRFIITLTGSYTQAGVGVGEILDFTNILNPSFYGNITPGFNPLPTPQDFSVNRGPAGYTAEVVSTGGAGLNNAFALKLFSASSTELAAGAYPAAILADNVEIELTASTWGG